MVSLDLPEKPQTPTRRPASCFDPPAFGAAGLCYNPGPGPGSTERMKPSQYTGQLAAQLGSSTEETYRRFPRPKLGGLRPHSRRPCCTDIVFGVACGQFKISAEILGFRVHSLVWGLGLRAEVYSAFLWILDLCAFAISCEGVWDIVPRSPKALNPQSMRP